MAQVVDLGGVLRGLRRGRFLVLVAVLVGVVGAGIYVALSTTSYVAKAQVVLPPAPVDPQGHDVRDINTEVQIVQGAAVLGPTTQAVQPPISLAELQRSLSVRAVTPRILELAVRSASASRAAQLANAVAASYVAYADDTATSGANAIVAAYAQEVSQLNQQTQQLDQQISRGTAALPTLRSAEAQRQGAVIDELRAEQSVLTQQLNNDETKIANALLQAQLSRQGTQVLLPASAPSRPAGPKPLVDIALGAVGGLLIGGILALAVESGDHRLRTRDGIGEAVGAPVLASLAVKSMDRPERGKAVLERWEPSVVESYGLRQALARLASGGASMTNLVLVGLAGDAEAAVLAVELAVFSAMQGTQTALVLASHDEGTTAVRAACHAAAPDGLSPRPGLTIHGAVGNVEPDRLDGAELAITFLVAESGPILVPTWDRLTRAALVVTAGRFTADRLEVVAAACVEAGVELSGAFVANPDPRDRSTGQQVGLLAAASAAWAGTHHEHNGAPVADGRVTPVSGPEGPASGQEGRTSGG